MEEETPTSFFPQLPSDPSELDFSFTSTASTSSFATTFTSTSSSSSARSSLSLSLPSFSTSTSLLDPLPHSKSDRGSHWSAVRAAANLSRDGTLHLRHLHLLRHLGSGHLARVFHCRIKGSDAFDFALKVVDLDAVTKSTDDAGKLLHVRTEGRVLAAVDHPFLPTLYARMDASHYACFLIDYCSGGDLHSLLVRQPGHRLPISAARFFAAEVLLALEYLHALGFVYRDLKPENVLIRSNGHIMLSDFDLCFSSEMNPEVHRRRVIRRRKRSRFGGKSRSEEVEEVEMVAEPVGAFSRACVGTHEYLAPEIIGGGGHSNGVDWWAFGVFVYELLYGKTPFKGSSKEITLKNIMANKEVKFPESNEEDKDNEARDLIRKLLVTDPKERFGSKRGASEIKKHPFFKEVRWQMMRSEKPPVAVGSAGEAVIKEGGGAKRGWWSRIMNCVSGNKGVKLGLVLMGSSNKSKRRKSNAKEKKGRRV